jgi:hypothetical protein
MNLRAYAREFMYAREFIKQLEQTNLISTREFEQTNRSRASPTGE